VGAESTRPGATPISEAEELARLDRVLCELARTLPAAVSIDTYKAHVAARAVEMGAAIVNDVGGLRRDPAMADVVAEREAAVIVMHSRPEKDAAVDVVDDIRRFFDGALARAERAGVARDRIVLDPGIGFGKTSQQNRDALARLGELKPYGCPIMVGVSRKAFLGSLVDRRVETTPSGVIAANLAAAAAGATVFRVHDVAAHAMALRVFHAIRGARPG
ncbi:MAG: dihydropteroate synthase, partial [Myxococcales bacterium]|nr:dihydropteroate synthase [Myxococcales bacterium]